MNDRNMIKGIVMNVLMILLLFGLSISSAHADLDENLRKLQQGANTAYEAMLQAQKDADYLAKDEAYAEKELEAAKQRLVDVEREAETARKKSADATKRLERAKLRWQEASDQLERAWLESGRQ